MGDPCTDGPACLLGSGACVSFICVPLSRKNVTCQSGAHKDVLNMYCVVIFEMSDLLYLHTVKLRTVVIANTFLMIEFLMVKFTSTCHV